LGGVRAAGGCPVWQTGVGGGRRALGVWGDPPHAGSAGGKAKVPAAPRPLRPRVRSHPWAQPRAPALLPSPPQSPPWALSRSARTPGHNPVPLPCSHPPKAHPGPSPGPLPPLGTTPCPCPAPIPPSKPTLGLLQVHSHPWAQPRALALLPSPP